MNDVTSTGKEFMDTVKATEQVQGQELFDEQKFMQGIDKSVCGFVTHIRGNDFLAKPEQELLISRLDMKIGDILKSALTRFDVPFSMVDEQEAQDLRVKIDLLARDANALIDGLIVSVDRQLKAKQTGIEGISDGEFAEILKSVAAVGEVNDYRLINEPAFADAVKALQGPVLQDVLLRTNLGRETVYIRQGTPSTLLLITLKEPRVFLNVPLNPFPNEAQVLQKVAAERAAAGVKEASNTVEAYNLDQVLHGHVDTLKAIPTPWDRFDATQRMAVESAYNMGLDAAREVKMQLLLYKIATSKGYVLPEKFALDGDFGPTSRVALQTVLLREGLPYDENSLSRNLQTLRELHNRTFPTDNTELFLTAEEINDPRYKFENKGVYRGLKVEQVKTRLLKNSFDIHALKAEKVFDQDISDKVVEAFPRALAVLQKLTPDQDLQASVLATMIMETGLSTWKDDWGVGRGDIKEYVNFAETHLPSVTNALSAYTPTPLETNSAGIMQVNYKTAQGILKETTGGYWSKDELIAKLGGSVEFSTVMAFLVFQKNQEDLQKAQRQFGALS